MTDHQQYFEHGRGAGRTLRREEDASRVVGELLLQCGITPHLLGFELLREQVRITAKRERLKNRPTLRDLRSATGSLCGACSAEHAVRDAIGAGFLSADGIHTRLFPFSDRPGSAEFVCTLAELALDRIAQDGRSIAAADGGE